VRSELGALAGGEVFGVFGRREKSPDAFQLSAFLGDLAQVDNPADAFQVGQVSLFCFYRLRAGHSGRIAALPAVAVKNCIFRYFAFIFRYSGGAASGHKKGRFHRGNRPIT